MAISAAMVAAETTVAVTAARSISTTTAPQLTSSSSLQQLPTVIAQSDHQVVGQRRNLAVCFQR